MLDTPGMREIGLWDAEEAVDESFEDLVELADRCRFVNCSHRLEPGCAIRAAVAAGRLDEGRVKSYRRLSHELAELASPAVRREQERRFHKAAHSAAEAAMARKKYRSGRG
jgi:ribosome biogenesis GTPase